MTAQLKYKPRKRFRNPRMGWREKDQAWVIKADRDPWMLRKHIYSQDRSNGYSLKDYMVAIQTSYLLGMPEATEGEREAKARRRKAIDALRAGEIYLEERPDRAPRKAWELIMPGTGDRIGGDY